MNLRVRCGVWGCVAHLAALLFLSALPAVGQRASRANIAQELGFETQTGSALQGWWSNPPGTVIADDQVAHTGKWSVRLQRDAQSAATFSAMGRTLPVDFTGQTVELRGYLRLKDVSSYAGLWLRQDGNGKTLAIDNMQAQQVKDTRDWAEYRVALSLNPEAQQIVFGVLMEGTGTVWADDLELLVDGKPIADAAAEAPLPEDHSFDAGSKISLKALTPIQIENLATLARVWGFLKYHHPAVTGGQKHWDYELFHVMPAVLSAPDNPAANVAITEWIDKLGVVTPCKACVKPAGGDLQLKPDIAWISDRATLGPELSERLQRAYQNRTGRQFFVSVATAAGNARFAHEPSYANVSFPDAGYQLLALFRWWNMVQYWSPGREVAGQFWPGVLREFIPKIALAKDKDAYQLVLFELIGKLNDTHANLWSSLAVRPPAGSCWLPVQVRWVEGKAVIWHVSSIADEVPKPGLKAGDVVEKLDGTSVPDLFAQWAPYYAGSNDATRKRDLTAFVTRGACGPVAMDITRADKPLHVDAVRVAHFADSLPWHDRPGDTFVMLAPDVAYLKLSGVKTADVPSYFEKAKDAKGIIIDIRNYPSEYASYALASMLAQKPTKFIVFSHPDILNPGAFRYDAEPVITPAAQHYPAKVVVLVDEVTQSQAEFTTMALRAMPNTTVVGSMTAGADGDVSDILLPGGLRTMLSGLGVFYPNHAQTQRVGIVPDVVVTPTIKGIAAGRDEVLERAVEEIRRTPN